ncbi:hypothetical protein LCGC14_2041550, partial [marine sediment metagenome]
MGYNKNMKNIAFDIHGTLDNDPKGILKHYMKLACNFGWTIFVISGPPAERINKELVKLNIEVPVIVVSVVDYLKDKDIKMWQDDRGNWWCDENKWWVSKGDICREHGIDI